MEYFDQKSKVGEEHLPVAQGSLFEVSLQLGTTGVAAKKGFSRAVRRSRWHAISP